MKLLFSILVFMIGFKDLYGQPRVFDGLLVKTSIQGDKGYNNETYLISDNYYYNNEGIHFTTSYFNTADNLKERTTFKWSKMSSIYLTDLGRIYIAGPSSYYENNILYRNHKNDYRYIYVEDGYDPKKIIKEMIRICNFYRGDEEEPLDAENIEEAKDSFNTAEEMNKSKPKSRTY